MRRRDRFVLVAALLAVAAVAAAGRFAEPGAARVADLAAREGDWVRVGGTVAANADVSATGWVRFVLRDETGSVTVAFAGPGPVPADGDAVEVVGRVLWARGRHELRATAIGLVEAEAWPRVSLRDLAASAARWEGLRLRVWGVLEPGERDGWGVLRDPGGERSLAVRLDGDEAWGGPADVAGRLLFDAERFRHVLDARGDGPPPGDGNGVG